MTHEIVLQLLRGARVRDNKQYIYTGDMMAVARNNINNLAGHET